MQQKWTTFNHCSLQKYSRFAFNCIYEAVQTAIEGVWRRRRKLMKVIFPITFNALFNYPLRYSLLWLCFLLKHYTQHRARKLSLKKISLLLWCSVIAILLISIILMRIFCIKSCKNCTTKSLSLFSFSNFFSSLLIHAKLAKIWRILFYSFSIIIKRVNSKERGGEI